MNELCFVIFICWTFYNLIVGLSDFELIDWIKRPKRLIPRWIKTNVNCLMLSYANVRIVPRWIKRSA